MIVTGRNGNLTSPLHGYLENSRLLTKSRTTPVKYPGYSRQSARAQTFASWTLKEQACKLSEAGFFSPRKTISYKEQKKTFIVCNILLAVSDCFFLFYRAWWFSSLFSMWGRAAELGPGGRAVGGACAMDAAMSVCRGQYFFGVYWTCPGSCPSKWGMLQ